MSKSKNLLKEILTALKTNPSLTNTASVIDTFLKESEIRIKRYKKIATTVSLVASIVYNVLATLGIW
jgi:hypothetical protein